MSLEERMKVFYEEGSETVRQKKEAGEETESSTD